MPPGMSTTPTLGTGQSLPENNGWQSACSSNARCGRLSPFQRMTNCQLRPPSQSRHDCTAQDQVPKCTCIAVQQGLFVPGPTHMHNSLSA